MALGEKVGEWLDAAKNWWAGFNIKEWSERVGGSSADAVEAGIYFFISFIAGFVFKRYSNYILFSAVVSVLVVLGLEYTHVITIDWSFIKQSCGVTADGDTQSFFNHTVEWVKNHLLVTVATTVGFLIGYKLG